MLFNTITFFVFLIVVFAIFWKANTINARFGKCILLISSYIFYGWWDWRFLVLIAISSTADFILGKHIFRGTTPNHRKFFLFLSLAINLGILFFFKYFNFFIDSFEAVFGISQSAGWNSLHIILPVGISFYTFQTLSYSIDIYRRKIEPTHSALTFFTFVAFFPQLVAGPIERAQRLIPQFERKPVFSFSQANSGVKLMLWGLFKKMVIADQMAVMVNAVYANPESYGSWGIIIATSKCGSTNVI